MKKENAGKNFRWKISKEALSSPDQRFLKAATGGSPFLYALLLGNQNINNGLNGANNTSGAPQPAPTPDPKAGPSVKQRKRLE